MRKIIKYILRLLTGVDTENKYTMPKSDTTYTINDVDEKDAFNVYLNGTKLGSGEVVNCTVNDVNNCGFSSGSQNVFIGKNAGRDMGGNTPVPLDHRAGKCAKTNDFLNSKAGTAREPK